MAAASCGTFVVSRFSMTAPAVPPPVRSVPAVMPVIVPGPVPGKVWPEAKVICPLLLILNPVSAGTVGAVPNSRFNDADGVVNPDGTVKGIAALRVADASIMPSDCRANTHLTTVVIGEYIAKMMKQKTAKAESAMAV